MDRYIGEHPARAQLLGPFLTWSARSGLTGPLEIPGRRPPLPLVTLSDDQRWAEVETLLHDESIALSARVGGLLTLLFAQPLARICRMTVDQVHLHPDGVVTISFDSAPVELPEPLDQLVLAQLVAPGQASYPSDTRRWLFPGAVPGRHLTTGTIRARLVERGIHPAQSRKAAMFQLAATLPTPILAELLGLGTGTATKWAGLAARDWSQYAARRRTNQQLQPAQRSPRQQSGLLSS